ncbi:MAG: sulfur oxidation c-type cytochrome SoxA [Thiotrichaceae bacterium]|nr:sulfur oxidation c-type cytochrome SoxA [Thiotrichaceae bacterium]
MRHVFTKTVLMMGLSAFYFGAVQASEMSRDVPLEMEKPSYKIPWDRYSGWSPSDWSKFSTLRQAVSPPVSFMQKLDKSTRSNSNVIINDDEGDVIIGDPAKGKALVSDRKRGGSCYACHILPDAALPGNVGINISTVGVWGRDDEYLFNYIYDPRMFNPSTVMPPWGAHELFSKEEIKHIVAYLKTMNKPVKFENTQENPDTRAMPIETRDNFDEFVNPSMMNVDTAKGLFITEGSTGKSCQSCHEKPEVEFATWATDMPKVETRMNKVIGIEEFVTRHARATTGAEYLSQSDENLSMAIYLRFLANGHPIAIDKSDRNTQLSIHRGEELMHRKIGQLNFSCVDCHETSANKWIRGQYLGGFVGMLDHFPVYRTSRGEIWDIRKRFQWCGVAVRANELEPDAAEYGDIEMYLMSKNNGRVLNVPGIRH